MGTVTHVDFTPINKSKGFQGVVEPGAFRSAFVHFLPPILHIRSGLSDHHIWDAIEKEVPYQMTVNEREYWICLKNKNPVLRTHMNIHQVVDNCAYLEKLIVTQAAEIEELKKLVSKMVFIMTKFDTDTATTVLHNFRPINRNKSVEVVESSGDDEE
jgi:hypothetical protein